MKELIYFYNQTKPRQIHLSLLLFVIAYIVLTEILFLVLPFSLILASIVSTVGLVCIFVACSELIAFLYEAHQDKLHHFIGRR